MQIILNIQKNFYGEQKFSFKEKIIKLLSYLNLIKTSMNLDIDFSVSEKGYYRSPHRDRNTRVINFLIYLNTIKKEYGGSLEIHEFKHNKSSQESYSRFPAKNDVKCVKKINAKAGRLVVFSSSPNSYHAAEKIKKDNLKRVFIYGSFSLNKKVNWKKISHLMKNNICVFGLGYVGLPLAIEFSKLFNVVGFDKSKNRVKELKIGIDKNNVISKNILLKSKINFTNEKFSMKDCGHFHNNCSNSS